MKRIILSLIILIVSGLFAVAQQWTEVVYLKDGSVIRGTIIEQIPDASLKIQTADGSVFVYEMDKVQKITKEEIAAKTPGSFRPFPNVSSTTIEPIPTEPYAGRSAEGKFLLDLAAGIAPVKMDDIGDRFLAQEELAQYVKARNLLGLTLHFGGAYEHYFMRNSPWLYSISLYGEWLSVGMKWVGTGQFYPGKRIATISYNVWDVAAAAGVGFQSAPNTEGWHFYVKAGIGACYMIVGGGKGKVFNPETGELHSTTERSGEELMAATDDKNNFYLKPYAEIGIGGDSYYRFGIRYSPLLMHRPIHCITVAVLIPLF